MSDEQFHQSMWEAVLQSPVFKEVLKQNAVLCLELNKEDNDSTKMKSLLKLTRTNFWDERGHFFETLLERFKISKRYFESQFSCQMCGWKEDKKQSVITPSTEPCRKCGAAFLVVESFSDILLFEWKEDVQFFPPEEFRRGDTVAKLVAVVGRKFTYVFHEPYRASSERVKGGMVIACIYERQRNQPLGSMLEFETTMMSEKSAKDILEEERMRAVQRLEFWKEQLKEISK